MKLEIEDSKLITVGDIKEYKTGIDPKNIGFITTLLSSKLYSNPEKSFIREIVSNAWDSHVEAGTTDTPVIVRLDKKNSSITVRDYGTGLSKERFENVYCNIGSSTKRESNDYIGGFGIGKYSSLACSDTVYITSYYKGVQYSYIMIKSGGTITTTLVGEIATDEPNGLEITIKNVCKFKPYIEGLENIMFFPNVYVDSEDTLWFNSLKIKEYKSFSCINRNTNTASILLGNVLYPVETPKCTELSSAYYIMRNSGAVLKFSVGELEVTPNRENIVYTDNSINKLKERAIEFKKEFFKLVEDKICKDYTDILEFYKISSSTIYVNPMTFEIDNKYSIETCPVQSNLIDFKKITYKGQSISTLDANSDIFNILNWIKVYNIDNAYSRTTDGFVLFYGLKTGKAVLIKTNLARISKVVKEYLIKKYSGKTVYITYYKSAEDITKTVLNSRQTYIRDEVWEVFKSYITYLDTKTDRDYLEYKKSFKPKTENKNSKIVLHMEALNILKNFDDIESAKKYIEGLKKGVIILDLDNYYIHKNNVGKLSCIPIGVSIESKKILDSINICNRSTLDKIYNKRKVRQLCTIHYSDSNFYKYRNDSFFIEILNNKNKSEIEELNRIYGLGLDTEVINIENKSDRYTEELLKKLDNLYCTYVKTREKVTNLITYANRKDLIHYCLVKNKDYRINYKLYRECVNSELIKFIKELCKE